MYGVAGVSLHPMTGDRRWPGPARRSETICQGYPPILFEAASTLVRMIPKVLDWGVPNTQFAFQPPCCGGHGKVNNCPTIFFNRLRRDGDRGMMMNHGPMLLWAFGWGTQTVKRQLEYRPDVVVLISPFLRSLRKSIALSIMDIASIVYSAAEVYMPRRPDIYIDEGAEVTKPKPIPLREPRCVPSYVDAIEEEPYPDPHSTFDTGSDIHLEPMKTDNRRKHESYDLSGSVFLITSNGRTLDLPMPSDSRNDPLNWSWWKTGGAMIALGSYGLTALTGVQAVGLMTESVVADFSEEVSF